MESPQNGKAEIDENINGITITVASPKNWLLIVFFGFFGGVWSIGMLGGLIVVLTQGGLPALLFLMFSLIIIAVIVSFPLRFFIWSIWGKQVITFELNVLTIEKKGLLFSKPKSYDLNEARNFRVQEDVNMFTGPFGIRPYQVFNFNNIGIIRFDYGMQTIKFADGVDEAEANYLLEKLRSKKLIH